MTWQQSMVMASHWVGLTLPGMIERAGLVLRQAQLAEAAARARAQEADVVRDLHQRDRERVQGTRELDKGVVRRQRLELVVRGLEGQSGDGRDLGREGLGEALLGVQAGADGGAALRQLGHARQRRLHALDPIADLLHVAGELLAQRQGRRILQMRPPDLDDALELLALGLERRVEMA